MLYFLYISFFFLYNLDFGVMWSEYISENILIFMLYVEIIVFLYKNGFL